MTQKNPESIISGVAGYFESKPQYRLVLVYGSAAMSVESATMAKSTQSAKCDNSGAGLPMNSASVRDPDTATAPESRMDRFSPRSDVDIAVAGERPYTHEELTNAAMDLEALLGREIDILDLRRVEGLILHRAVTEGVKVKLDSGLFARFHQKALGFQADYLPLLQRMRREKIRRFIRG